MHVTLAPTPARAAVQPAHRRLQHHRLDVHPVRVAAAIAKGALLEAAAIELGSAVALLTSKDGVITAPDGASATYGELAAQGRQQHRPSRSKVELKPARRFEVIGKPVNRIDARDIVTGQKKFAMDLEVPGRAADDGLPAADAERLAEGRPQQGRGAGDAGRHRRRQVDTGVAVRAKTFGQCIDAMRALEVDWNTGTGRGRVRRDVLAELRKAELPLAVPRSPRWPRRSRPTSPSCSAAAPRSSRTPRSPTCGPTARRSGPG